MLQQKYNWIEKCWQVPPIRRIWECCGLCCYVGQPDPWSPYSYADPDPTACAPRSRCCDPRSHPFFAFDLWSHTLLRPCLVTIFPPMSLFTVMLLVWLYPVINTQCASQRFLLKKSLLAPDDFTSVYRVLLLLLFLYWWSSFDPG